MAQKDNFKSCVEFERVHTRSPKPSYIMLFVIQLIAMFLIAQQLCAFSEAAANMSQQKTKNIRLTDGPKEAQASDLMTYYPQATKHQKLSDIVDPIGTAASHYHHKKSTKGWLDMGAWTKKKGAFGWYADFPVGKGK